LVRAIARINMYSISTAYSQEYRKFKHTNVHTKNNSVAEKCVK